MATNMLRKLTIAALGIAAKDLVKEMKEGETREVAKLLGKADAYKVSPNKFDPTREDAKFIGQFEGYNLLTGEVAVSRYCYLPGGADELIRDALDMAEKSGANGVDFAFSVSLKKSEKTNVGYVYVIAAAYEPQENDPLEALRNRLGIDTRPALAAPAREPEPATEKKGKRAKAE